MAKSQLCAFSDDVFCIRVEPTASACEIDYFVVYDESGYTNSNQNAFHLFGTRIDLIIYEKS